MKGHPSYRQHYCEVCNTVESKGADLKNYSEIVEHAINAQEEAGPPIHAWDTLDTEGQHQDADDGLQSVTIHPDYSALEPDSEHTVHSDVVHDVAGHIPIAADHRPSFLTNEQYLAKVRSLTLSRPRHFNSHKPQ